ncbi:MAG: site-specific integrase [Azonexus sp.]|nr:site-specific integrase [Azonexus sp.]MDZ4314133.1 site-specific integrase [Azonexus sp.]
MPIIALSATLIRTLSCPATKGKIDYFDANCKGLLLEVRKSGGKSWYLRYSDGHAKQHQYRIALLDDMSLPQARKRANELRGQIALGIDPTAEKSTRRSVPTFADFIEQRYLPFVKGYKRSWKTDESLLRNHLLPMLGKRHLDEISKTDIVSIHHGRRAAGAALGSANRLLIMLRYIFNLAVRWETPGVTANPTKDVGLFENPNKMERYLSQAEAQRLYETVCESENTMLQFIIPMLILTGARKREVLDAQWQDFNLLLRQWRIPVTKAGKPRYVPLSDGVLQLLAAVPHNDDCPWVFPNPKTRRPYVSFFCSWDTARAKAGLTDVRIHDLRHSFASFLVNAGRSLYEVQKILGHTQVKTTQRYAHLSQETLIDAANAAMLATGVIFTPRLVSVKAGVRSV